MKTADKIKWGDWNFPCNPNLSNTDICFGARLVCAFCGVGFTAPRGTNPDCALCYPCGNAYDGHYSELD